MNEITAADVASGSIVMAALSPVYLSASIIKDIKRWWNGDIGGRRFVKNIVDPVVSIPLTLAGGVCGSMFGAIQGLVTRGPLGMLDGTIACGVDGAMAGNKISDLLTEMIFGLPKEEALENAYKYFGLKMTASNDEINSAFRRLCQKNHPDKGGCLVEFHRTQLHMAVIKAARGSL